MGDPPMIKCKKCDNIFQPDMKTKGPWICPACQKKNPNLKRHYRSVADLYILGLIVTAFYVAVGFSQAGLNLDILLSAGHAILLLITIVLVYKSQTPWTDETAKALIWTVYGLACFFNVVLPLVLTGILHIPATVVYAFVFLYLFWLNAQADKCTAAVAPLGSEKEES